MFFWIGLAVFAQLINALSVIIDKYLLNSENGVRDPVVYTFYVSMLSGIVLIMAPFGVVSWPGSDTIFLSLMTAAAYIFSILCLYQSLKISSASDVVPVAGAVSAITTFVFAYWFLHQDLPEGFLLAFSFLTAGLFLISGFRFTGKSFSYVFLAGVFFGASAFLMKLLFLSASFADGFFWSRMANVLVALLLLFLPQTYVAIRNRIKVSPARTKWLVVGNKAMAGFAFILTLFAINIGSVSVVNSLSGLQFVFLLPLAYFFHQKMPKSFPGEIEHHRFPHKLVGIISIIIGFFVLFFK